MLKLFMKKDSTKIPSNPKPKSLEGWATLERLKQELNNDLTADSLQEQITQVQEQITRKKKRKLWTFLLPCLVAVVCVSVMGIYYNQISKQYAQQIQTAKQELDAQVASYNQQLESIR